MNLTINGTAYTYPATPAQLAGLTAARQTVMAALPPGPAPQDANTLVASRPGYVADDTDYLVASIAPWATAHPSGITTTTPGTDAQGHPVNLTTTFAVTDMIAQCLNSWAGTTATPATVAAVPLTAAQTQAALVAYAADKRYRVETGGTSVSNMPMATDRDTQAKLNAAFNLANAVPASTFNWKTPSGFVTFTANQVIGIAVAVGQFVSKAYSTEATVGAAIAAGTITTTAQIDSAAWPT